MTRPVLLATFIALLAAALRAFHLGQAGWPDPVYAATVRSMLDGPANFWFLAIEPGGSLSLDKPPLGFWLQSLSAAILGFSPVALILPQLAASVASVVLLYLAVARRHGPTTALLAAAILAALPVSVANARGQAVDPLVGLLSVGALALLDDALLAGRARSLYLGAALLGLAFETKFVEGLVVAPALAVAWCLAPHPLSPPPRGGEGPNAGDGAGFGDRDGDGPLPLPPPLEGEGPNAEGGAGCGARAFAIVPSPVATGEGQGIVPSPVATGEGQGEGVSVVTTAEDSGSHARPAPTSPLPLGEGQGEGVPGGAFRWQTLLVAGGAFLLVALAWPVSVWLTPASGRPAILNADGNSVWSLIVGYDGLLGFTREAGSRATLALVAQPEGPARLLVGPLVTQIGWLVVAGLVGAVRALWRAGRGDPGQLAWGVWALTGLAVCLVSGRVAPQYLDSFTPALAACAALGVTGAGKAFGRGRWARLALPLLLAVQAGYLLVIIGRVAAGEAQLTVIRSLVVAGLLLAVAGLALSLPRHFSWRAGGPGSRPHPVPLPEGEGTKARVRARFDESTTARRLRPLSLWERDRVRASPGPRLSITPGFALTPRQSPLSPGERDRVRASVLAGRRSLSRVLLQLGAWVVLVACPASWTIGALEPAAVAWAQPRGAWASFDVARARAAYRVSLASEESSPAPAGPMTAEATLQADAMGPEVIAMASEDGAAGGPGTRDLLAAMTVEQAARVVLTTNRPVAILYDEYRSRPLVSTSEVARLARSSEVRLFAVSPVALASVDPDLGRWIDANTARVGGTAANNGLQLREYRAGG